MDTSVKAALELVRRDAPQTRPSASSRIYDDLRQRILSLELPPGTNLLRAELAQHYEVSVTPLRDALQKLETDGLVRIYPQSRTLVTRIDEALVHEGHFLRRALETEVVRHLAERGAPETVERARSVIALQRSVRDEDGQLRLFQELDEHFHRTLFDGLGREALHDLIRSRAGHLDRVRRLQSHSPEKIRAILRGHDAIVDAIEARDVEAAMSAMRDHLFKSPDWVGEFRATHEDYFA
ncbi:GntR family transcriptional regulator [Roseivivax sediminis]|uniref:DNA-binding transcriptional regulator, GntR family n=1 Tax=Roseivivax sediminis TaxID=936889 RepID=A0A1I2CIV6_9RHOB|nr:GntR family transcriptional regulator [Roseivivax sediminis]SFE67743.1 DNA-binding transcriptional regulator, GntR family [Roseivivax sediminis]